MDGNEKSPLIETDKSGDIQNPDFTIKVEKMGGDGYGFRWVFKPGVTKPLQNEWEVLWPLEAIIASFAGFSTNEEDVFGEVTGAIDKVLVEKRIKYGVADDRGELLSKMPTEPPETGKK